MVTGDQGRSRGPGQGLGSPGPTLLAAPLSSPGCTRGCSPEPGELGAAMAHTPGVRGGRAAAARLTAPDAARVKGGGGT